MKRLDEILELVLAERQRQDTKWGVGFDGRSDAFWLTILAEEFGEVANAILERDEANVEVELVQAAAVIFSWLQFRTASADQYAKDLEKGQRGSITPEAIG